MNLGHDRETGPTSWGSPMQNPDQLRYANTDDARGEGNIISPRDGGIHDNDTPVEQPDSREKYLANTAPPVHIETPVEVGEKQRLTSRAKKIAAGIVTTIVAAGAGAVATYALSRGPSEIEDTPPQAKPTATAPANPSAGETVAPKVEETLETYTYHVNGKEIKGNAELSKTYSIDGKLSHEAAIPVVFNTINAWMNSGNTPEEKAKGESYASQSGATGAEALAGDFYHPAFVNIIATHAGEVLEPGRGSMGIEQPGQLIDKVTEFHGNGLKNNVTTKFVPISKPKILGKIADPNFKTKDGAVNNISVLIDEVAIQMNDGSGPVTVTKQKWGFSLYRVPAEGGDTVWKIGSFSSTNVQ